MAVFRIEKTRDYTVMSNHHLRDMSLSLKAKGLLSLMLSLPENWDYTMKGLSRICKDGIDSISGGIRELEEHGYLIRERVRGANGQLGSIEYTILEQPKEPTPAQEKPIRENPVQANPTLVTPVQEEPAQLNKDKSSNDPSRTDLSSTEVSNPIQSNPPTPAGARMGTDGMGARESYRELILENIEYDFWKNSDRVDHEMLDEITELIVDTVRLATAKQRVSELEVLLCKIYEDNILGKLSDSRYATLDAQYEKEQTELTAEISALEKAVKSYEKHEKDADRFIALIDKYENFDKLTIAMLNEFIEKILVHERDRKGSIQTTQEVEIYFNFVGRFVPPAFGEAELTPEELEEIRKREERKDRLHQNYLKRKASGAQKRYEDKIKERKKAEIEAKKAAIRAEDIAKGVFVPVSSLPQREPMKGVQTA